MKKQTLGATGQYPQGKLNADDEGELRMAIVSKGKTVVIDFGKPVHWLGMSKDEARAFGELIIQKANEP